MTLPGPHFYPEPKRGVHMHRLSDQHATMPEASMVNWLADIVYHLIVRLYLLELFVCGCCVYDDEHAHRWHPGVLCSGAVRAPGM
jgi:hypothetical protein